LLFFKKFLDDGEITMKKTLFSFSLIIIFLGMVFANPLFSQYQLKRSVIGNGGGKVSNSSNTLFYTVGQPLIGKSNNSSNSGKFGFWYTAQANSGGATLDITLHHGWNMISENIILTVDSMTSIWSTLTDSLLIIKNGSGMFWMPPTTGTLRNWNTINGYLAYMTGTGTLHFSGQRIAENTPIPVSGWNLVSYLPQFPRLAPSALCSIDSNLVIVKNGEGEFYFPMFNINTLETNSSTYAGMMMPGKGYQLYTVKSGHIDYSCSSPRISDNISFEKEPLPAYYRAISDMTGNNSSLVIESINISEGVELGIFNTSGKIIGSGVVHNGRAAINLIGDDIMTNFNDGAITNEILTVKAYYPNTKSEVEVIMTDIFDLSSNSSSSTLTYKKDGIYVAHGSVAEDSQILRLQVSPNPVSNNALIDYFLPDDGNTKVDLFNTQGQRISRLVDGEQSAGAKRILLNSEDIASGVYNIVLSHSGTQISQMVVIIK
jgi:hypothetical protein